jgi:four helix bundle protein
MKYQRFEELPVWKAAEELGARALALTDHPWFRSHGGVRDQLERAAISISNNIAEGFERGTTAELLTFIYYARGSAGEVRSMMHILGRRAAAGAPGISDLKSEISNLIPLSESIFRQLHGWAEHLQNCDIAGPKRLTKQSKSEYNRKHRAAAIIEQLERKYPIVGEGEQ